MTTKRVLVADQNSGSRELLRILLEHEGCEVSEAGDGWQAIEIARKDLPDLVLLDLELPELDGYAVLRALRSDARLKDRAIVALTGDMRGSDVERMYQAGFTSHITKPIVKQSLSAQLHDLLPQRQGTSR